MQAAAMSAGLSEFEIIRRYFERAPRGALLGVGDDAALVRPAPGMELAVSTDMLLEGRHFPAGTEPRALGHKALAVNLSDMAAMGATPRWATLAIALPECDEAWLAAFAEGLFALAARHRVDLIGGDTTRGALTISITIFGEVPPGLALLRGGAHPGDDIWVSGELGGAALALAHAQGRVALAPAAAASTRQRLEEPEPRVELGLRLRGLASAAIDVSDGLAGDLGHIVERSGTGALVHYERLPKAAAFERLADPELERDCVLSGGDDYELCFTAPAARRAEIEALPPATGLALTRVGAMQAGEPRLIVLDATGKPLAPRGGFDHFARRS
jgi:thiamine-monophosphate kinase